MSNSFQDKLERGGKGGGLISGLAYNLMYFFVVNRKMSLELEGLISEEEAYKWLFMVF